jgi:hypothetical protein
MTVETLKDCNKKVLARMAKEHGIVGWHAMRKDQLIRALAPAASGAKKASASGHDKAPGSSGHANGNGNGQRKAAGKAPRRPATAHSHGAAVVGTPVRSLAPLPPRPLDHACIKDRILMMVRDSFWLHAHWELSRTTLARAQAALGQEWHTARPILRLMDVTSEDTTSASERHVRDIEIHGGVNNWYLDVLDPPRSFRVDIGYLSKRGKFFVLARSNVVTTPKAGASDMLEQHVTAADDHVQRMSHQSGSHGPAAPMDDLRDLFEERLRRPMHGFSLQTLGTGALPLLGRGFHFELDAELVVYGATEPNARVTLQGEPVQIRKDGTFTVRFALPDARQIIPACAASPDGVEERTIVLAVERNTKELEPMIHDGNEL